MTSLRNWLANKLVTKNEKTIVIIVSILIVLAALGFADATHLTISHYTGAALKCGVSGGCNTVTNSVYSKIFGIPVALLGSLFYVSIITLCISYLDTKKIIFLRLLTLVPVAGLLASIYFVSIQLFVLHTICFYCMISAGTSTTIFLVSQILRFKK